MIASQVELRCRVCRGVVLAQDSDGRWVMRHNHRAMRFSIAGEMDVELDCREQHTTRFLIDERGVAILMS